jgi:GT2 family glycosyltransferase
MYQAEVSITTPYDALLWLNNDVVLYDKSLTALEAKRELYSDAILVGQMCSSSNSENITYGGHLKTGRHPFRFEMVKADLAPMYVDTFSGNLVFIPFSLSTLIGHIEGRFQHAYADIDFGLRAKKLKIKIIALPGFMGVCDVNPPLSLRSMTMRKKISLLVSAKYSPIKSQILFLSRHGGIEWPIYLITPFLKIFFRRKI